MDFDDHSLLPALRELDRLFGHFGRKLPFKQQRLSKPVITIQAARRRRAYGWFAHRAWRTAGSGHVPEINFSAEHLARERYEIANTLLHEMVHLSNYVAGVRDCSSTQYHNKTFKDLAERIGLHCDRADDGRNRYGYAFTSLSDDLKSEVDRIGYDDNAFSLFREPEFTSKKPGLPWDNTKPAEPKLKKWSCGCTNVWSAVQVNACCTHFNCGNAFRRTPTLGPP